jgi:hypothetical protein
VVRARGAGQEVAGRKPSTADQQHGLGHVTPCAVQRARDPAKPGGAL